MWAEFEECELYPSLHAAPVPRCRCGEAIAIRAADWAIELCVAGAPLFYATLVSAYVAVELGVIV